MPPETIFTPRADERAGHGAGVGDDLSLVVLELGLQGLEERDRLGGDDVHQRPALRAREDQRVELLRQLVVGAGEDQAAARPAQRLVRGGRDDVGVGHRIRVHARGDEAGDVRHVHQEIGADRVRDLAEARPVDDARVGREAGDDHLRPVLAGEALDLVVVDLAGGRIEPVLHGLEDLAGEIDLGAVREVTAVVEAHAEQRVAGLHEREVGRGVGLRARMRLHVGVVGAEQLLRAVDGELLGHVHVLAAAVVALARIALGVLVGEHRPLRLEHARTGVVLGGDQLDVVFLADALVLERRREFGIEPGDLHAGGEHGHSKVGDPQL